MVFNIILDCIFGKFVESSTHFIRLSILGSQIKIDKLWTNYERKWS